MASTTSPTFDEWLEKYFKDPTPTILYTAKHDGKKHTYEVLISRYKRAYKNSVAAQKGRI